jgi:hypothetical protein
MRQQQSITLTEIFTDARTGQHAERKITLDALDIKSEIEDVKGGGCKITTRRDNRTYEVKQSGNRVARKIIRKINAQGRADLRSARAWERAALRI